MGATRHVRAARWAGALLVGLAPLPFLAVAASADDSSFTSQASSSSGGVLTIHDEGSPSGVLDNELTVCVFNVEGFSFGTGQTGYVLVEPASSQGGYGGPVAWGPADGTGFAATDFFNSGAGASLGDGDYHAVLYARMLPTGELRHVLASSPKFSVACGGDTSSPTPTHTSGSPRPTTTSPSVTPTSTSPTGTPTTVTATPTESSSSEPATTSPPGPTSTTKSPTVLPTRSSQPAVLPHTGPSFPTGFALAGSLLLVALGAWLILGPGRPAVFRLDRRH